MMHFYAVLFATILSSALGAPQFQPAAYYSQQPYSAQTYTTPIPIISYTQEVNPDGSYFYNYQTGNGIAAEEKGYIKNKGAPENELIQEVVGFFAYPSVDGKQISVQYTANEEGFKAYGDHLPTPPPVPAELIKAYENAPKDSEEYNEQGFPKGQPSAAPNRRYQRWLSSRKH